MRTVLLFGASGAVGRFLLPLLDADYKVLPISRTAREGWMRGDLSDKAMTWPPADIVISLGPLDAFAASLERQSTPARRAIALSSMSAISKKASADPAERELAERLRDSEAKVLAASARQGIACTILRPTLIYGAGTDRSLAPIARFAQRWHILPIPIDAFGLRQPVHAADLARACVDALDCPATFGRTYELGGSERLSFTALLWRLRAITPGFVLPLPIPLFLLILMVKLRRAAFVNPAALARLRQPLLADNRDAERDFSYAPCPFRAEDVLGSSDD